MDLGIGLKLACNRGSQGEHHESEINVKDSRRWTHLHASSSPLSGIRISPVIYIDEMVNVINPARYLIKK